MDGHPSPEQEFLANLPVVERVIAFVARRHHLSPVDADDFASHVKLALIADNYAVFRKFQKRSSLRTYLTVVINRIFLDYRIGAWGKWRPSAEAKRGGPVAILLERLVSRDGHTFEEACELLASHHQVSLSRDELERLAARLPVKARRRFESDDALADIASPLSADQELLAHEREERSGQIIGALTTVLGELAPQDRLILTLRFTDGRGISEIAAMLRLEQKPLYRRVDTLLRSLRSSLEARDIDATAVTDLLELPAS